MQFFIIVLIIVFIIFLFCLHILSKEELIFVRKNITIESLFNIAFLTSFFGLLMSRVIFVVLNPSLDYLNPLVFLLFPYFPGLSLVGGVVGGLVFLFYYGKLKKLPTTRIFDYFSVALLATFPLGFFGAQLLQGLPDLFSALVIPASYIITFILFVKVLLPLQLRGEIKDGSLGLLFLMFFSFTSLLVNIVHARIEINSFLKIDNIFYILMFFGALVAVFLLERGPKRSKPSRLS